MPLIKIYVATLFCLIYTFNIATAADDLKQLIIKTLNAKTFSIDVKPCNTIYKVKEKIQDREGIPPDQQRIIFNGQQLYEYKTLTDYNIPNNSTMYCVLRNRGGSW